MSIWINLTYACGGVKLDCFGCVVEAPPIFKWMIGKHRQVILDWVWKKNGYAEVR